MNLTRRANGHIPAKGGAPPGEQVLVRAEGLCAGYQEVPVIRDLDLHVGAGEVVALLGPNGAGKSTTLLTLSGELPAISGAVLWNGRRTTAPLHRRARDGLSYLTEERAVFSRLTTMENLRVGRGDVDHALRLFPELRRKLGTRAGLLSGGEQQMLALARALSRSPRVLFVDELSLGLAPLVVSRLLATIRQVADTGMGVLIVEQHVGRVLEIADRVYVMRRGRVEMAGTAGELRDRLAEIEASYLSDRDGADLSADRPAQS